MDIFTGNFTPLTITAGDKKYIIDAEIYRRACIVQFSSGIGHTIEPAIDGVQYAMAPKIIELIYKIGLGKNIYSPKLDITSLTDIPRHLAMFEWCRVLLADNAETRELHKQFRNFVSPFIKTVRAIVCSDDALVGGSAERYKLICASGLKFSLPEWISGGVLVHTKLSTTDTMYAEGSRTKTLGDMCDYRFKSEFAKKYIDVLDFTQSVRNEIIRREVMICCYTQPEFMKIAGFGDECRAMMHIIFALSELDLHCVNSPGLTICDVFQHGLGYAMLN